MCVDMVKEITELPRERVAKDTVYCIMSLVISLSVTCVCITCLLISILLTPLEHTPGVNV